nr:hypothetical protein [Tanacetum cinerariifolium]
MATTLEQHVALDKALVPSAQRNTKAYKEYYACATGEAAPKPKASSKKKKGGSTSSTTPSTPIATPTPTTTVMAAPRLSSAAKGKQPARATTLTEPTDIERTKAEQLKIILRREQTRDAHFSATWFRDDDDDDQDETKKVNDDNDNEEEVPKIDKQETTESDKGDNEATESDRESKDEETREQEEESFDPIPWTLEESEDDDNNEEDQGLRIGEEERIQEEKEADELYRDVDFNQGRGLQVSQETEDSHLILTPTQENDEFLKTIDENMRKIIKEQVKTQVKAQVTRILPRIEESVNAHLEAEVLTRSSHSSKTSYAVAADLSEMELKKILIDKMEENKSIQCSDEQRNIYKALVEAYYVDKTILETYEESFILKRRREDDDQEGPSAGSDRGSTTGTQSQQLSASETAFAEEPVQTTCQMKEPSHPVFETGVEDQPIV